MIQDEQYMQRCIALARKGAPHAAPNPTVGAVIVCDDRIIGEGYHRRCGGPHAEINAINSVRDKSLLARSTVYVTLEPCSHYGKTPPCADKLINIGVKRVVIGCVDPFARVHGNGIRKLLDAGIEVTVGVCEKECLELISHFRTFHEKKRPYIVLKWAQSADGYIDTMRKGGHPVVISNPFTQMLVHRMRSRCNAIMVGTNTAMLDNPSLTTRLWYGDSPLRVVIDRHNILPKDLHLFDGTVPTIVFTSEENVTPVQGVEYITLSREEDNLSEILGHLHSRNIQTLLVEGGCRLLQSFIDDGLWDEARVETAPQPLGNGIQAPKLKDYIMTDIRQSFGAYLTAYRHRIPDNMQKQK